MDSESFDLSIKTLKGEMFQVNVNPTDTIKEVKQKIQALKGFDAGQIKLVCQGKLLDKAQFSLTEYNIKKTDFLVVMVPKVKAPPKKPDAPKPAAQQKPTTSASSNTNPPATGPSAPAATSSSSAVATVPKEANQLATGPQLEAVIKGIQDMGFARDDIKIALRAAYNNPDRAVEYLMSGVPTHILQQQAQAAMAHRAGAAGGASSSAGGAIHSASTAAGGGGGGNALPQNFPPEFQNLVTNPMFQQLRQRVIQDPNFLQQIMGQLQQSDPALYNAINQNPMQFMQLLLAGGAPGGAGSGLGGAGSRHPPGTIQITVEEKQAIERLQALGFEKVRAAEAYFACDKNEQMAANFLFENATMDDKYFAGEDVEGGNAPAAAAPAPPQAPSSSNPEPAPSQDPAPPKPIEEPKDDVPQDAQNDKKQDDGDDDKHEGSAFD